MLNFASICILVVITAAVLMTGCKEHERTITDSGSKSQPALVPRTISKNGMDDDIKIIDDFLVKWDQFAQGKNELAPVIKQSKTEFENALTRLLSNRDTRAPVRLVFYAVVQVGGIIEADSKLGQATRPILGDNFKIFTNKQGVEMLFAGDLYFWWRDHMNEYEAFPLFDEWQSRDFAMTVVIPMYESVRQNK